MVFVGYHCYETPECVIQDCREWVRHDERRYDIRAHDHSLSAYSVHADQRILINFVSNMGIPSGKIVLVHVEAETKKILNRK